MWWLDSMTTILFFTKSYRNQEAERDVDAVHGAEAWEQTTLLGNGDDGAGKRACNGFPKTFGSWSRMALRWCKMGRCRALTFERPEIVFDTKDAGDWFDIKAMVHIAGFSIPFLKFRRHILQGKRDYVLPNGSTALLPEEWFSDYRHLLEIAEQRDDDTLSIRKYQAVVLDMPLHNKSNFKQKLGELVSVMEVREYDLPSVG
jgi:hypothetical protein